MGKFFKMLFILELILLILIAALSLTGNQKIPTAYAVKEISGKNSSIEKNDFKISTKAVCKEKSGKVFCRDELFIRCNGNEYIIENDSNAFLECSDVGIRLSDIIKDIDKIKKE